MVKYQITSRAKTHGIDPSAMTDTQFQDLRVEMIEELYPGLEKSPEWLQQLMTSSAGPESLARASVVINGGFDECQHSLLVSLMTSTHKGFVRLMASYLGMLYYK